MPNYLEVTAYETGVRLTQAMSLLSDTGEIPSEEILSALVRLESISRRLRFGNENVTSLERFNQLVSLSLTGWIEADDQSKSEAVLIRSQEQIHSAHSVLMSALDQISPTQGLWLGLGLVIADGSDETWSDGIPCIQPRTYSPNLPVEDRLPYMELGMVNATPRRWDWNNENAVTGHAEQLNIAMTVIFPSGEACFASDEKIFRLLPFKRFWGWFAIEDGLHNLTELCLTPRWDATTQTLSLGGTVLHHYSNRASNQATILSAFEDRGWQLTIECPFNNSKQANQVVTDLNRTLRSTPIRFRGGVTGIHWEYRERTAE